jgi:2-polyprenyl-3-methyl-5-hydroxy-6-metoxy-1,4-benzoquinol methylase
MGQEYIACANCKSNNYRELLKVKGNRGVEFISYQHHIVVCEKCGLAFINPQHDDHDYDQYYKALNFKKDKVITKAKILKKRKFKKIPIKFLTDYLKSEQISAIPSQVLDVGCGLGVGLNFMQEYGLKAEGLEPSSSAVDFAHKHFGAKVHVGSIFNHDLPANHYDVLSCMSVIEHLTDPLLALKQMRKLLKTGGILFMTAPDLKGVVLRKGSNSFFKFVHTFYYTNITLTSLIQLAGFEVVRTWQRNPILKYSTFFHPANARHGELNVIAQKKNLSDDPLPLKENVDEIFRFFKEAKKRDSRYHRIDAFLQMKCLGLPLRYIRSKFTKPQYVFRDYFEGTEVVADYQTI